MKIFEKLSKPCQETGTVTFAFLGDSVTHGCFASGSDMHTHFNFSAVYHNRFKQMLNVIYPSKPISIINAGIGGDNAAGGEKRLNRDVLSKSPDMCVVCFGLNDVNGRLDTYINSLDKIFCRLKQSDIAPLFLTPNMLNTYVDSENISENLIDYANITADFQNSGRMDKYIKNAIDCAQKNGVPVADCYGDWKSMYECGIDTTVLLANRINHPITEMHNLFASKILETILKNKL